MAVAGTQRQQLREAFAMYDNDRDGFVNIDELIRIVQAMGFAPTPADAEGVRRTCERLYGGRLDIHCVGAVVDNIVVERLQPPNPDTVANGIRTWQLLSGKAACKASGCVPLSDLNHLMTVCGDRLSVREYLEFQRCLPGSIAAAPQQQVANTAVSGQAAAEAATRARSMGGANEPLIDIAHLTQRLIKGNNIAHSEAGIARLRGR